jgi:hypothetical protein
MTVVAIHQPNYMPWLGYFAKAMHADIFVFLDDVQFSKNSYTNRVQILQKKERRWLTVPVRAHLGDPINRLRAADPDWLSQHLAVLKNLYKDALHFKSLWHTLSELYSSLPDSDIATINILLIQAVSELLGLRCRFVRSSMIDVGSLSGDERLAAIVKALTGSGTYLSGRGGADYQRPEIFTAAGISLRYLDFVHPEYVQPTEIFVPGLSILDAAFRLGWPETSLLLQARPCPS